MTIQTVVGPEISGCHQQLPPVFVGIQGASCHHDFVVLPVLLVVRGFAAMEVPQRPAKNCVLGLFFTCP